MKSNDRPTDIARITLTNADGTVEEIEVTDDLHFLLGFARCGPDGGHGLPLEFLVKGNENIVGELFYRIGVTHPQIIQYCRKRIDLGADAFENAPVVGGVQ